MVLNLHSVIFWEEEVEAMEQVEKYAPFSYKKELYWLAAI